MFAADELQRIAPPVFFWQAWSPEVKAELGSTAIVVRGGLVLVDPIPLVPALFEELTAEFPPLAIVLTNDNHERHSRALAERLNLPRYAHPAAGGGKGGMLALGEGEVLFEAVRVIELPGAAPGEVALLVEDAGLLVIGDALINMASTGFTRLPAKYCTDPRQLDESLKKLLAFSFEMMTFAHGLPIPHQAKRQLQSVLTS
ncbi:MAG: hypothetical protein QM796_03930 [Chthoniobacteraceae bacterium]